MNKIIEQYRPKDGSTRSLLRAMYNLLKDPKHWTQHVFAMTKDGHYTKFDHKNACSWCLVGSYRALSDNGAQRNRAINKIYEEIGCASSLAGFNDTNSHETVIKMLKKVKG